MKKSKDSTIDRIKVVYFQRRPRPNFSFSLEYIFEDVRNKLKDKIIAEIKISKFFNDGYLTKFYNIVEAACRQGNSVNHITGEMHFLDLLMKKKTVLLTVLDCGMMQRKTGIAKYIVKYLYLTWPIKRSNYVTAISEITKQEIIVYTKCDPNKIIIVPVAVDAIYQPAPKEFNSLQPSILHIGTGPNKNLIRLIEALQGLNCKLEIVGKLNQEQIDALIKNNISYHVESGISQERMLEKYKACDILSFISTFEGFGMPIVEANCVERVVITSNMSSMPEVAGNAACLVDPYSVNDIRQGVIKLIDNKNYRRELINNGRINKLRFDSEKIAELYLSLYKKIAINN